jgi:outer membrane protein assembly factor BamB
MLLLLALAAAPAADWPQFLGPTRDGVTTETVPAWTGTPAVAWKRPVGPAHSSPVVSGGVVYAFDQPKGKNADRLTALELATGKVVWEKSTDRPEFNPPFGAGPRGTPSVTGGKVYTLGGTGILACWDAKTGDVVWQRDTLKDFKVDNLVFGVSASPLVADGRVFVNVGGKGAGLVAFAADTGKTLWQATDDGASYSSPILADGSVVFLTKQRLVAVDPASGAVKWSHPFKDALQESATAPLWADGTLIGSSVTLGSVALTPGPDGAKVKWQSRKLNCYFSTPVLAGDSLFMLNGVLSFTPSITLRCVDPATGKVRWERPDIGKYHAALTRDGAGNLLMFDDYGKLTLFAADAAKYRELATAKVSGPTWAHPAVAGGYVVIRDEKELIALKLR